MVNGVHASGVVSFEANNQVLARVLTALMAGLAMAACSSPRSATVPSAPPIAASTDPKDLAEALLLGSGPLSDPDNISPCAGRTTVLGWRPGSDIDVRVWSQVSATDLSRIQQVVDRIPEATLGRVHAHIDATDDRLPVAQPGQITVTSAQESVSLGCNPGAALCTIYVAFTSPFLNGSRILGVGGGNFPHELGHAVFGFCHTRNPNVFDKETIMAGGWSLTDRDVAMLQSLYAAGLGPGATRSDLVRAGIINP
jgi:hypothetical protein